jgi:hypothetical protein
LHCFVSRPTARAFGNLLSLSWTHPCSGVSDVGWRACVALVQVLLNRGDTDVVLNGWSLQSKTMNEYGNAIVLSITGTIKAFSYFLVNPSYSARPAGADLPTPDSTTSGLNQVCCVCSVWSQAWSRAFARVRERAHGRAWVWDALARLGVPHHAASAPSCRRARRAVATCRGFPFAPSQLELAFAFGWFPTSHRWT